jgi:peptidoglycan/xylan/chitin deacetylase (PgdA/CDA1 family)
MISLFTRDDYSAAGLTQLLDGERLPYRRIARLDDHRDGLLVVAARDLSSIEVSAIVPHRALVLHGGPVFAALVLGAAGESGDGPVAIGLDQSPWSAAVAETARRFGITALRLPRARHLRLRGDGHAGPLASMRPETSADPVPAAMRVGGCTWCALDLGSAFADLLTESYGAAPPPRAPRVRTLLRGIAERAYYAVPERLRARLRAASYRALERRCVALGARASAYPIDPTGWLTIEWTMSLLRQTGAMLPRLARWPAPYRAAAVLTHDIEPRRYAYRSGLSRLLARAQRGAARGAIGLVARPAVRHLDRARAGALGAGEVYCHGLDHRGEPVHGRARVLRTLVHARAMLERHLGRPIRGYRSPRLDRSPDLDWALDRAGFAFDSSRPDVDRENLEHYGRGVRLNLPYRVPVRDAGGAWRASRCLELPLTAPDCIQPLFVGHAVDALRRAVEEKAAFVRATGGLYVALVHAGVFGDADAARREAHADRLAAALRSDTTWLATPERVADWWCAREGLHIETGARAVRVRNAGAHAVRDAVLVLERGGAALPIALPPIAAGGAVHVPLPADADAIERGVDAA